MINATLALALVACAPAPVLAAEKPCCSCIVDVPTREQTRAFLARLGVTPETACAAGVANADVEGLFQTAGDTLDTLRPSLEAADVSVNSARATLASLRSAASQSGLAPDAAALSQAEGALATAVATQTTLLNTAFESSTASLSTQSRSLLGVLRVNQDQPVRIEFKLVLHTTAEWKSLQQALNHVKSRQACGLEPMPDRMAIVMVAATSTEASQAKARLETNLGLLRAAWMQEAAH